MDDIRDGFLSISDQFIPVFHLNCLRIQNFIKIKTA